MTLLGQPLLQRVAPQVLVHHQNPDTGSRKTRQPATHHVVEFALAHLDGGIAPHRRERNVVGHLLRCGHGHVAQSEGRGVVARQSSGAGVHVDGPHATLRSTSRHRQRDHPGSATEVEQVSSFGQLGSLEQEEFRAGVNATVREDAGVGLHLERTVGKGDLDALARGLHLGFLAEVVLVRVVGGGSHGIGSLSRMTYQIRTFGDPVLASQALPVTDIDAKIVRIVDEMFDTLYDSDSGIGLAAPQVGIQRQIFVWDMDDEPMVVLNPVIVESDGEWVYDEGCLSIPGLYVEMTRPKTVLMKGIDMNGNEVAIEADELEARLFQHELDHLNGVLMFDRMQPEQRKAAMAEYKKLTEQAAGLGAPKRLKAE